MANDFHKKGNSRVKRRKTQMTNIRLTKRERALYQGLADKASVPLSQWIRWACGDYAAKNIK